MIIRKVTLFLAVCVVSVLAFKVWAYRQVTATKSSATPATIVYLIKNFDEKGAPGPNDILIRAHRSDGSEAQYLESLSGRPPIRSAMNYQRRVQGSVDPLIKAMVTYPIRQDARIPATCESAWGSGRCLGAVSEKILGFALERVSRTDVDGGADEFLVAPALDYRPLKRTVTESSGSVVQDWTAIDVRLGEPDEALFEFPEDYVTVSRDVFYQKGMEARSKKPDPALVERFRALEEGKAPAPGCRR
jgi:hypothetical protein